MVTLEKYLEIVGQTPREFREELECSDPKWIESLSEIVDIGERDDKLQRVQVLVS